MKNSRKGIRLTPFMRQVLMFEMFRHCKMIDNNVINQYLPYVDSESRRIKFSAAVKKRIERDLKSLRYAGVIEYKYREKEKYYDSYPCDFTLAIPEDTSDSDKKTLIHLNLICRFVDILNDIENETLEKEDKSEDEIDDTVFDYKLEYEKRLYSDKRPLNDLDLYRYDDPFVLEYIKLSGSTSMAKVKEDFELLVTLRYLYYDRMRRRFRVCEDCSCGETRQDYGVIRGKDGQLYI